MPNDAKLGLVMGVGLVIAVAVVFFRKDLVPATPPSAEPAAIAARPAPPPPPAEPRVQYRPVTARPANRPESAPASRSHTVEEGETLRDLARRYYGDEDRSEEIYQANRDLIPAPDQLTPGTVLVIPELTARAASAHP